MTRVVVVRDLGVCGPYVVEGVADLDNQEYARGWAAGLTRRDDALTAFVEGDPDGRLADWLEFPVGDQAAFVWRIEAALRGEMA